MLSKIGTWEYYWERFDELVNNLRAHNKLDIAAELKDAQLYVNGLTDGWYGFKDEFERILADHKEEFTPDQYAIADYLLRGLKQSLLCR